MSDLFDGCEYVSQLGKARLPDGSLVARRVFNVVYGGHQFLLGGDLETTSAWMAFMYSKVYGWTIEVKV
jgi:hypothetical protein